MAGLSPQLLRREIERVHEVKRPARARGDARGGGRGGRRELGKISSTDDRHVQMPPRLSASVVFKVRAKRQTAPNRARSRFGPRISRAGGRRRAAFAQGARRERFQPGAGSVRYAASTAAVSKKSSRRVILPPEKVKKWMMSLSKVLSVAVTRARTNRRTTTC